MINTNDLSTPAWFFLPMCLYLSSSLPSLGADRILVSLCTSFLSRHHPFKLTTHYNSTVELTPPAHFTPSKLQPIVPSSLLSAAG